MELQNNATDYAGTTSWGFYTDASGSPGMALFSGNTMATGVATGNTTLGLNEFSYTFLVNITLGPGNYWLLLHNGAATTIPNTNYFWAWSADAGNSKSTDVIVPVTGPILPNPPVITWIGNDSELAFSAHDQCCTGARYSVSGWGRPAGCLVRPPENGFESLREQLMKRLLIVSSIALLGLSVSAQTPTAITTAAAGVSDTLQNYAKLNPAVPVAADSDNEVEIPNQFYIPRNRVGTNSVTPTVATPTSTMYNQTTP